MFSSLKHTERKKGNKKPMASARFHMNVNTNPDEAHNKHFDLQNSPYHTWPHPITANHYSFKIFSRF